MTWEICPQHWKGRLNLVRTKGLVILTLAMMLGVASAALAVDEEGTWFQVSLGFHGMAMDDLNNTDFRWHEDSPDGFNLDKLNSGMALSFGIGYDMSPLVTYGLFWEHQYASTSGTDQDIKADVNLAADIFTGRLGLNFLRKEKWRLGVAGAMGFLVSGGEVNKTTAGASYGQTDLSGNCMTIEGMANLDISMNETSIIQITGGWRLANVESFKYGGAPALGDDGQEMSLDYSGFTARVGIKYRFGSADEQTAPEIH